MNISRIDYEAIQAGVGIHTWNRVTFKGGTGDPGAIGSTTIFTVTGAVAVKVVAFVDVTLVGAATIELGTTATTAGIIAQVSDATGLAAGEIWHDATPDASVELVSGLASFAEKIVSQDIKLKVASAAITAGRINFVCFWRPITDDGKVTSAVAGGQGSSSPSPSPSASASASVSPSTSASKSSSPSASLSPSSSLSPSTSVSRSASASVSPSSSASASASPSGSKSPSASQSPSSSASPSLGA